MSDETHVPNLNRYEARETGGVGTWWVEDKETRTTNGRSEVAATYWGWVHPDPEGAAKAEAARLNALRTGAGRAE